MKCPQCSAANPDYADSCSHCGTPIPVKDLETVEAAAGESLAVGGDFGPRYRIEALLGQGGMGRVYKAYDKDLDRVVAIKVIHPGMIGNAEIVSRFKQELLLASKISHKNILRIHDMGSVGDRRFISMAFVEGPDLHEILKNNPKLPIERILNLAHQLAEALAAAHAEGVVHRDLKPQNILIDKEDHVYVSDFGLAKSLEENAVGMTRTGAVFGTPRYMSPEQVKGQPADQRSDLYAYGLIVYEMAVGDVPFTGTTAMEVMYQRVQEVPKSPKVANPALPDWLARIISRCLERDPNHRYQSAYEILADLQAAGKSPAGTRTIQIAIPEFSPRRWIFVASAVAIVFSLIAVSPPVRHMLFPSRGAKGTSRVSGVPSLAEGKFVAALPFRILGQTQSLDYVAEGLYEAISAKLFQLGDLRLASDAAVAKVSNQEPLEKTAHSLGANLIISGTIQGDAANMAIIANLTDVPDGRKLWSGTFSGNAQDLLTLEDKICTELVAALALKPADEEQARTVGHPTENTEAYDLYLKGRNAMRGQQDPKNIQAAIGFFNQAVKKDSEFALAYAGIADASLQMYTASKETLWSQKALGAAQQAERLNDKLPEVHLSIGDVYSATGQSAQAIVELKRALELAPNSDDGYRRLGTAYLSAGNGDKAIQAMEKAVEINPYYWTNHNSLGVAWLQLGDYPKALSAFHHVTELEPDNIWGYQNTAAVYFDQGKYQDAIPFIQKTLEIQPDGQNYSNLATAYYYLQRYKESVPLFEKAATMNPNDELLIGNLADAYRATGENQQALATYDKAIALAYKELEVNPRKASTMGHIAVYYARKGSSAQAVDLIRRARHIDSADVDLMYDAGVVYALAKDPKDAVETLRDAFRSGYSTEQAKTDPDLQSLRNLPDFEKLLNQFGKQAR